MSLSNRDRILLVAVLVAVLLGGGWYLLVRPAQADVAAKEDQLAAIESEIGQREDEIARLAASPESHVERTVERLWLAKAVPSGDQTAGAVVELQRLADQSGVELAAVRTVSRTAYGPLEGTQYEVDVVGRFYNVDDFLYRLHALVELDRGDSPEIEGRLLATLKVDMGLESQLGAGVTPGTQLAPADEVRATVTVVAFAESSAPALSEDPGIADPSVGGEAGGPAGAGSGATTTTPAPDPAAGSGGGTTQTTTPAPGETAPAQGEAPQPGEAGPEQTTAQPGGGGVTQ